MKKFFKNKKWFLILGVIFILIFFLGIKQILTQKVQKINRQQVLKKEKEFYKKELEKYPEFKDLLKILEPGGNLEQQEKQFYQLLQAEVISVAGKKTETEIWLIKESQDLLKNIAVDKAKSNFAYVNEFKKEVEKLKLVNLDFSDKNNLALSGEYVYNIASNLSRIKPSEAYEQFHKAEVLLLAMMGKSLLKLAETNDYDEAMALSSILNSLADLQEEIIKEL